MANEKMNRITFEGNFCDICQCVGEPGNTSECPGGYCDQRRTWERLKEYEDKIDRGELIEVVHGRWEDRYGGKYANPAYDCSECKKSALFRNDMDLLGNWKSVQYLSDYCPNCGAKMDGDGNGNLLFADTEEIIDATD